MNPDRSKIPSVLGEFGEQLAISEILNPLQIEELNIKIETGRWPTTARELASRLCYDKRWLTEYQAKKLLSRKASELLVGRYTIRDKIGAGAMGEVYMAEHQFMGRVVALKMIKQEMMSDRLVKRFLKEMRLAARMDHPNVVSAYDADQIDNLFYIAMEYVPGKSLGELLKAAGPMEPKKVVKYGAQAALGLHHAHQQGILHRDVKPSNILLSSETRTVKLLDLGLGTLIESTAGDPTITQPGNVVGTYDYMSPEQVKGRTLDGRSDLYSLACTMYHMMAGQLPFRHEIPLKRMSMRIDTKPIPISEYVRVPKRLEQILMQRMLATDPDDRYQTGQEVHDVLMSLIPKPPGSSTVVQVETPPAPTPEPPPDVSDEPEGGDAKPDKKSGNSGDGSSGAMPPLSPPLRIKMLKAAIAILSLAAAFYLGTYW